MPNSRQSSATQSVHYFSFPRFPAFSSSPDMTLLAYRTCGHPCGVAPPTTITSSCARLFRCSRIRFAGGRVIRRGCVCSATCTRLLGFEGTPYGYNMNNLPVSRGILYPVLVTLFLAFFSVLVAIPKKYIHTVANNTARGLLDRERSGNAPPQTQTLLVRRK